MATYSHNTLSLETLSQPKGTNMIKITIACILTYSIMLLAVVAHADDQRTDSMVFESGMTIVVVTERADVVATISKTSEVKESE